MLEAAKSFFEKAKGMVPEAIREAVKELPQEVRALYYEMRKASYFVPANARTEHRTEHVSPSGKYVLTVTPYAVGKGYSDYSQGLVNRNHKGKKGWTVDLEWAVKTGPIKLDVFKDGNKHESKFFPHTVEAMHEAFAYAKGLV